MYCIGVDTGGTFTDFVFYDGEEFSTSKILSTPNNPTHAIIEGLKKSIPDFTNIDILIHGTTVATNALLEKKGALTCLITTKGFEDILEIKRQDRGELYNLFWTSGKPLIDKKLRFGISERTDFKGNVLKETDSDELDRIINTIQKTGIESVAVCFINSYVNPRNEKNVSERLSGLNIPFTISSELIPEFREYERTSTTVVNSYLIPKVNDYMTLLRDSLPDLDISVIQSNGGLVSLEQSSGEPSRIILSGPAGGVVGAFKVSEASGRNRVITYDMGGTSTDISLCDEEISFTTENSIDGYPVKVPMIDISTIGAGGGSIAYLDSGGALHVGPESAGADPGPACYGKGQTPTVTDANLVLGRIEPGMFLGGNMEIYPERAYSAVESLGISGFSVYELAESIVDIANSNMEKALRIISIGKGFDPRDFTLVSFGGAGGLHACELARSIGVKDVLFPINPGTLSAFGMLVADSFKDYSHTQFFVLEKNTNEKLDNLYSELQTKAEKDLGEKNLKFQKFIDARYKRQSHELSLPYSRNLNSDFHSLHSKVFGYCKEDDDIEIVTLRLRAFISRQAIDIPFLKKEKTDVPFKISEVIYNKGKSDFRLYKRDDFYPGFGFEGASLILDSNSTLFIPPETESHVDKYGNIFTTIQN